MANADALVKKNAESLNPCWAYGIARARPFPCTRKEAIRHCRIPRTWNCDQPEDLQWFGRRYNLRYEAGSVQGRFPRRWQTCRANRLPVCCHCRSHPTDWCKHGHQRIPKPMSEQVIFGCVCSPGSGSVIWASSRCATRASARSSSTGCQNCVSDAQRSRGSQQLISRSA